MKTKKDIIIPAGTHLEEVDGVVKTSLLIDEGIIASVTIQDAPNAPDYIDESIKSQAE